MNAPVLGGVSDVGLAEKECSRDLRPLLPQPKETPECAILRLAPSAYNAKRLQACFECQYHVKFYVFKEVAAQGVRQGCGGIFIAIPCSVGLMNEMCPFSSRAENRIERRGSMSGKLGYGEAVEPISTPHSPTNSPVRSNSDVTRALGIPGGA
jgi:hypothetical protein